MGTLLNFLTFTLAIGFIHPLNGQIASLADQDFQSYLPLEFKKTNFTLEDAKNLLIEKCRKALPSANLTAESQFQNIEKAANILQQCGENIGDMSMLTQEIEKARPNGDLDIVFKKHCENLPKIRNCLKDFNEQWILCLSPAERQQNIVVMKIVTTLLDFVCEKSGAYISIFIAEEGPECFEMQKDNISNCLNATLSSYMPAMPPTELPELVMAAEQCMDLHHLEKCILSYMEQCSNETPAAIIESLFKYVRNETKCQEEIDKVIGCHESNGQQRNAATGGAEAISWLCMHVAGVVMILNGIIWKL